MYWQVNHGLPEIKKNLNSAPVNITDAIIVGVQEVIYGSLNYVVSVFVSLRGLGKSQVSEKQVGKKEILYVND